MRYRNLSDVPMGYPIYNLVKEFNGEIEYSPGHSKLLKIVREQGIISTMAKVVPSVKRFEECIPILLDMGFIAIKNKKYYIIENEDL